MKKYQKPADTATHIYFRQVILDTVKLDGRLSYRMFSDTNEFIDERAITVPEQEMMKWIFNNPSAVSILCEELDLPANYMWFLEVRDPIIKYFNRKPGDIDGMMCHKTDPRKTIAFESKRVKIKFDEANKEYLNKVDSLKKGVEQVNALSRLGFYKCYLFVMIITDGHNLTGSNQIFKRATSESLNKIYNFEGYKDLEENVGIILCLVTQLSGKSLNMNNAIAIREHKPSIPQEQPGYLNEDIENFLKKIKH